MHGVLVGVDLSEGSARALRWAAAVAASIREPLVVAQAWEYPGSTPMPWSRQSLPTPEEIDAQVVGATAQFADDTLGADHPADVHPLALRGPAAGALLQHAADEQPRLVVLGTRGLGGFAGLLLGSVSRQVLEHAATAVVLIGSDDEAPAMASGRLERVIVGTDGSPGAARAVRWTADLAGRAGAEVTVAHAFTPPQAEASAEVVEQLRDAADSELHGPWCSEVGDIAHRCVLRDGDARDVLGELALAEQADLVVLGARGRSHTRQLLGSVASAVSAHAPVPVAVVPDDR